MIDSSNQDMAAIPDVRTSTLQASRHALHEDVAAILLGTLFIALGAYIYSNSFLLIGGVAGLALLVQYVTGTSFWISFFVVNLPFYWLAWSRMGRIVAFRTFLAVGLVSLFSYLTTSWISFAHLDSFYAAAIGGGLCGVGLLMLFRHRTGLGGFNILAMVAQERWGMRAGHVQLTLDMAIMGGAIFVLTAGQLVLSVIGAMIVNLVLASNHRPGRYTGTS